MLTSTRQGRDELNYHVSMLDDIIVLFKLLERYADVEERLDPYEMSYGRTR